MGGLIKKLWLIFAIAAFCLYSCGGGFGAESEEARDLGPGIFGPDSARR